MSSSAIPITPRRFAEAIRELPLANIHFKAAEIRNSIAHLVSSNQQLQPFANEGDSDCADAIEENLVVIKRMEERTLLLQNELKGRSLIWTGVGSGTENLESSESDSVGEVRVASQVTHDRPSTRPSSGRLGDEELAQRLGTEVGEVSDNKAQDGVHL